MIYLDNLLSIMSYACSIIFFILGNSDITWRYFEGKGLRSMGTLHLFPFFHLFCIFSILPDNKQGCFNHNCEYDKDNSKDHGLLLDNRLLVLWRNLKNRFRSNSL